MCTVQVVHYSLQYVYLIIEEVVQPITCSLGFNKYQYPGVSVCVCVHACVCVGM